MYVISSISPSSRWDESLYESSDKVTDVSPELAIGMVILEVILLAAELIWLLPLIWFHLSMIPSISRAFSWFLSAFDNDFWLEFSLGIGGELFDLLDPDLLVEVLEVCTIDSSTFQGFYYKTLVKWNNFVFFQTPDYHLSFHFKRFSIGWSPRGTRRCSLRNFRDQTLSFIVKFWFLVRYCILTTFWCLKHRLFAASPFWQPRKLVVLLEFKEW